MGVTLTIKSASAKKGQQPSDAAGIVLQTVIDNAKALAQNQPMPEKRTSPIDWEEIGRTRAKSWTPEEFKNPVEISSTSSPTGRSQPVPQRTSENSTKSSDSPTPEEQARLLELPQDEMFRLLSQDHSQYSSAHLLWLAQNCPPTVIDRIASSLM